MLYKKTNHYLNSDRDLDDYKKGYPNNIKVANFGSTYSYYSFCCHKELNISSANFALNCESIELDLDIMKHYSHNFAKGCIVILHLNFCVSVYRLNKLDESRKNWDVLPHNNHIKVSFKKRLKHLLPLSPFEIKKGARIILDVPDISNNIYNVVTKKQAETTAKNMASCWINLFNVTSLKTALKGEHVKDVEYNTKKVEQFITFCLENKFKPVIACTPLGAELNKYVSSEFEQSTIGSIIDTTKRLNVPFLNYRTDERFQNELTLFFDGCYKLSHRGSLKYLKILFNDIQTYYHIPMNNKSLKV